MKAGLPYRAVKGNPVTVSAAELPFAALCDSNDPITEQEDKLYGKESSRS